MNQRLFKNLRLVLVFTFICTLVFGSIAANTSYAITGDGSWTNPYSVAQGIANQNNTLKTVQGYVVGQPTATNTVITSNYPNDYALALADSASETNTANMIYVQIPTNYRTTFGMMSNPTSKGSLIKVTGYLTAYFTHPGSKNVTQMEKVTSGGTTGGTTTGTGGTATTTYDSTYYSTAIGKTGSALKTSLHNIIDNHTKLSYDALWEALRKTDEDPNNTNNVILLYTGRSQSKLTNGGGVNDWNREHVWAKSKGDFGTIAGAGTDLHHIRPTDVSVNSTRSNKDFDNGGTPDVEATLCKTDADSWEPRDAVKGDVARMLFYMAVRYEGDITGEPNLELNDLINTTTAPYHGRLSVLLQWHIQDPVDNWERKRNDIIYNTYQHNRNPFIDHPEWVDLIW